MLPLQLDPGSGTNDDSTVRFSNRAEYYSRCRPGYPDEALFYLRQAIGFSQDAVIVDIGSGPGNSAKLFLRNGYQVYGIEPNLEMRNLAESLTQQYPRFCVRNGTAEATGLPAECGDLVVAASVAHWCDVKRACSEFRRILKVGGVLVLMNNEARKESPLMKACADLARKCHRKPPRGVTYNHKESAAKFLGDYSSKQIPYEQVLDWSGFLGRQLSYSTAPLPGEAGHQELLDELRKAFSEHNVNGVVRLEYHTTLFWGPPGGGVECGLCRRAYAALKASLASKKSY